MSDDLCEKRQSIMACPKCGTRLTNKFQILTPKKKVKRTPLLLESKCDNCGYDVGSVQIPKQYFGRYNKH